MIDDAWLYDIRLWIPGVHVTILTLMYDNSISHERRITLIYDMSYVKSQEMQDDIDVWYAGLALG